MFTIDIESKFILKVVLVIEEFDLENGFKHDKEVPQNINLFPQIVASLKDLYLKYINDKISSHKFNESLDKISAANFATKKFEITEAQNLLLLKSEASYFLLKKKLVLSNPFALAYDERHHPDSQAIHDALKNMDLKSSALQNQNLKGAKDFKPSKIDLSKIPSNSLENEEIDEEYKPYLKQTSLSNPQSILTKEIFLKHKRRRSSVPKPNNKQPSYLTNLYNEYQDILANINLSTIEKYCNMQKYKETITN